MSFFPSFRRLLLLAVPTVVVFSGCSKDDEPVTPAPDQGRVNFFHMAASANVGLKFLADDAEKASLTYGQSSNYQSVNTGNRTLKVNVATSGAAAATPTTLNVEKDKNYSYFAYANSSSTVAGLLVPDDLAAPASGQAKIRLIHLAQGAPSPLKISSSSVAGLVDVAGINVQFAGNAPQPGDPATIGSSSFVSFPPGTYNLVVSTGNPSVAVANVGDGTGSGTGTKNYEAGKIYTVVVRGINNVLLDPALQPKAVLIQNN